MSNVAVIGLGWMGLPMAALYASVGHNVTGYDINEKLVDSINNETINRNEKELKGILDKTLGKNFYATSDPRKLSNSNIFSIIVPLIINEDKSLDWRAIDSAVKTVGEEMPEGSLVMIHTTMPIEGTESKIKKILDQYRKKYYLAYLPIRAMTPHAIPDMREKYPRIVAGINDESRKLAVEFLKTFFKNKIIEMDVKDAEATKIFEVIYRDVNIALANELAVYSEKLGLNFWKIREAANSVPYYHLHKPGPGVGGHCLPVYPYLLLNLLNPKEELGLIRKAREINDWMPIHTVDLLEEESMKINKKMRSVTIFGFGYRAGIGEIRFSPSIKIAEELKKRGYEVWACDPYLPNDILSQWGKPVNIEKGLEADGLIFVVDHPEFLRLKNEIDPSKVVVDGRNLFNGKFRTIGRSYKNMKFN